MGAFECSLFLVINNVQESSHIRGKVYITAEEQRCLISGDYLHSAAFFCYCLPCEVRATDERGVKERGRRNWEVLKGAGNVTRVIVQLTLWHPHSHERAINTLASKELKVLVDHQHPLMRSPHRVTLLNFKTER